MRTRLVLAVLFATALGSQAHAFTRETPAIRLSSQSTSSGAKTASVAIPSSTTNAIITFYFASSNSNQAPTSVSLDGQSATKKVSDETAGVMDIATYTVPSGLSTGSGKTLAWTNGTGYTVLDIGVEFRDSTPTYGATDFDDCNGCGTLTSVALSNTSGDEILCPYSLNGAGSISSVGAGQTKEDETSGASKYGVTTKTGAGGTTTASFTETGGGLLGYNCLVITFSGGTPAASFDSGPTFAKVDGNTYRMTYDTANATTAYVAAYPVGTATPTAAALIAGTGAHGTANEAATNAADTLDMDVTDSPPFPAYKVCGVAAGAGGNSAVTCNSAVCLDPPSNFQFVNCSAGLTSVGAGSPADTYNSSGRVTISFAAQTVNYTVGALVVGGTSGAYGTIEIIADFGPTGVLTIHTLSGSFQNGETLTDNYGGNGSASTGTSSIRAIATGDIEVVPSTLSPSGATLTVDTDGQFSYSATGRQTALNGVIFDPSIPSYLTLDLDFIANNSNPSCSVNRSLALTVGAVMSTYDVSAQCSDADNDTMTYAVISNNLPTGISLNATTGHLTGTPTSLGDVTVQILALDGYGGTGLFLLRVVTNLGVQSPDCMTTPTSLSVCESQYSAAFLSTVAFAENPKCSGSVAANDVIATTPTKNTTIPLGSNVSITYSTGSCQPAPTRMVNCLRKTLAACQTLVTASFGTGVTLVSTSSCPAGYPSGKIWTQSPGPGRRTPVPANLHVDYCP